MIENLKLSVRAIVDDCETHIGKEFLIEFLEDKKEMKFTTTDPIVAMQAFLNRVYDCGNREFHPNPWE